nr:putative intron-encoded reverse transcriptase [Eudorina cylindrica]
MTKLLLHRISRHAEYYNLSTEFDKLYKMSSKGTKITKLYDRIFSSRNIRLAYRNIKRNKGSKTPGVDKISIKQLQGRNVIKLVSQIQKTAKNFKPSKVRRVWIPKANGKLRPIGIPTMKDRLIQQCVKQVLEPICEAKFHKHSYGFRPFRSTKHALARCLRLINLSQLHYVVDLDIKSFFDTINHGKLLKQFWTIGIRDKKIISIISKMLKAEIEGEGKPTKGTPQGGVLSPLFSNIYLNELDWWLSSQWETFTTKQQYSLRKNARRAVKGSKLKQFYIVRYADDFKIFCKDRPTADKIYTATCQWLKQRLHLDISAEKSKITNLRKKGSDFLGITLRARKTKNKYTCYSKISPKALENMKSKLKALVNKIQKKPTTENVKIFNITVLGFHEYYKCATLCTKDFAQLGYILEKSIHNRLKKWISYQGKTSALFKKKFIHKTPTRFITDTPLFPIQDIRHQYPTCFSQDLTPYTEEGRKKVHKEINAAIKEGLDIISENPVGDQSIEYNDNRISKWVLTKGKCYISGELLGENFHCHHIKPRNQGGTDSFDNLVVLAPDMHKLIHAKDNTIISNLMVTHELKKKQLNKLNKLRELVGNESLESK